MGYELETEELYEASLESTRRINERAWIGCKESDYDFIEEARIRNDKSLLE
jgi:hypothetical protein